MVSRKPLEYLIGLATAGLVLLRYRGENTGKETTAVLEPETKGPQQTYPSPITYLDDGVVSVREPELRVESQIQPRYQASISPMTGGLVLTLDDLLVGSIFDSPLFKEADSRFRRNPFWLKPYERDILSRVEEDVQGDFRIDGQRRNSGKHGYSHIYGIVEELLKISLRAGIPLDFSLFLIPLTHEKIEDAPRTQMYNNQWLDALIKGDEQELAKYDALLAQERAMRKQDLEDAIKRYVPQSQVVRGGARKRLIEDIESAVRLVRALTRDKNKNPYWKSMRYANTVDGKEELGHTLYKIIAKNADGIRNLRETDPLPDETMQQLRMAFSDPNSVISHGDDGQRIEYVVGRELTKRYGSLDRDGQAMIAAQRIGNAAKRISALHYQNGTLSRYARIIFGDSYNKRTRQLFALARLTRDEMISAAVGNNLKYAIATYETFDEIKQVKPRVEELVKDRLKGWWFDRITADGAVKDWLLIDIGGDRVVKALDNTPHDQELNYEAAKMLLQTIVRFSKHYDPTVGDPVRGNLVLLDDPNSYDPRKHRFFTLGNFGDFVNKHMPDYISYLRERLMGLTTTR